VMATHSNLSESLARIRRWILRQPVPPNSEVAFLTEEQRELMMRVNLIAEQVGLQVRDPFDDADNDRDLPGSHLPPKGPAAPSRMSFGNPFALRGPTPCSSN
jgi:hypothetical protein